jgi:hypothetical protein
MSALDAISDHQPPTPSPLLGPGVAVHRRVVDVTAYRERWLSEHGPHGDADDVRTWRGPGGWMTTRAYLDVPELLDLATSSPLAELVADAIGEPGGVHFDFTGWIASARRWHPDGFLRPDNASDRSVTLWVALDVVPASSGPLEYVHDSQWWPRPIRSLAEAAFGSAADYGMPWPHRLQAVLDRAYAPLLATADIRCPELGGGDVIVMHPRVVHQSRPATSCLPRPSVVLHYSGITARPDMPPPVRAQGGGWFFPVLPIPLSAPNAPVPSTGVVPVAGG